MDKELLQSIITSGSAALVSFAEAAKTTSEHLYGVLVRQQIVNGIASIVAWISWAIFLYFSLNKIYQYLRKHREKGGYSDNEALYGNFIVASFVLIVLSFAIFGGLQTAVEQILNPEYYAIKYIIDSVKQ